MNVTSPICSHGQCPGRRLAPMRGRFTSRIKPTRFQATDHGPYGHLALIKGILGVIDTRSDATIGNYLGIGTIQIAIAGGTG